MNLLQEYLLEQLLNEDLNSAYEYYKDKLTREQFDRLIALDPTFNAESDKLGTYGKWIIAAYIRGTLKEEELGRVHETLNDFDERKRYLTGGANDINRYKTISEIRDALNTIQLTDNQKERLRRKAKQHADLGEQAEFVLDTDKWEVWIPKTYVASMKLGSGATWCTASSGGSGERYFHYYTDEWGKRGESEKTDCGVLYIFINKKDPTIKYQAQVVFDSTGKPKNVQTFMDVTDNHSIDFDDFIVKENLVDSLLKTNLKDLSEVKSSISTMRILETGKVKVRSLEGFSSRYADIYLEDGTKIKRGVLTSNPSIKEITVIGSSDSTVSSDAFERINSFEVIIFSDKCSITTIDDEAFKPCANLKKVILPPKLVNIGVESFAGCSGINELFIPDTVRYIGYNAFNGCKNIVLKLNKRTPRNNIKVPESNIEFLKQHIQYVNKDYESHKQPMAVESLSINEVFSQSTPQWLSKWIVNNKKNKDTKGEKLRITITGKHQSTMDTGNTTQSGINYGFIDLQKAKFITSDVPTSPRDKFLKDPYLPILHIVSEDPRGGEKNVEDVYIPGVNDNETAVFERPWVAKKYGEYPKTTIISHTVDFCYLDLSDPLNFISVKSKKDDIKSKEGSINRLSRSQMSRINKEHEQSYKNINMRYRRGTGYDKSGYKLDPSQLIKKLNLYNRENYSKSLKAYYDRINSLRKLLQKELLSLDIKTQRHDEEKVRDSYSQLFHVINIYRYLSDTISKILIDNAKDKINRDKRLNMLFGLEPNDYRFSFGDLRERILILEKIVKTISMTTLESVDYKF